MSVALAPLSDFATEVTVSDLLPEEGEPAEFYKSVLDDVNGQAGYYGWKGVTFRRVRYCEETRVFSVTVGQGALPATLHLMKKHIAEAAQAAHAGGEAE